MEMKKKRTEVTDTVFPVPTPHKGGCWKAGLWAVLAVLVVCVAAFWLTRKPEVREIWCEQAANIIDDATRGTPLAGIGSSLRKAPPLPPISVTQPPTAPGTLSGQIVQAPIEGNVTSEADSLERAQVTEDSRIRPGLVDDLARYIVSRYRPGPHGGVLSVSVQGLNQRYGLKFANQDQGGRAGLLRYAFHPTMLYGLYSLYIDRFLEALDNAAAGRSLTSEQIRQMKLSLAGRCVILAGALEGFVSLTDIEERLELIESLSQKSVNLNMELTEAIFTLDALREAQDNGAQMTTARLRVDGLAARYQRTLDELAAEKRTLVNAIRKGSGQTLDEDSLFFVAEWVGRRIRSDVQAQSAVSASAAVLRDLARRCALDSRKEGSTVGMDNE